MPEIATADVSGELMAEPIHGKGPAGASIIRLIETPVLAIRLKAARIACVFAVPADAIAY